MGFPLSIVFQMQDKKTNKNVRSIFYYYLNQTGHLYIYPYFIFCIIVWIDGWQKKMLFKRKWFPFLIHLQKIFIVIFFSRYNNLIQVKCFKGYIRIFFIFFTNWSLLEWMLDYTIYTWPFFWTKLDFRQKFVFMVYSTSFLI